VQARACGEERLCPLLEELVSCQSAAKLEERYFTEQLDPHSGEGAKAMRQVRCKAKGSCVVVDKANHVFRQLAHLQLAQRAHVNLCLCLRLHL
jgi:hypothetical protein